MTYARCYQQGVKAYLHSKLLNGNPYNCAVYPEAHDAWKDGWLDANHARRRVHALEAAARVYAKTLQPALYGFAPHAPATLEMGDDRCDRQSVLPRRLAVPNPFQRLA